MKFLAFALLPALLLPLLPGPALSQSLGMESDWLELVKGHRDNKSGAQIMEVMTDPATGGQMAMIKVPKGALDDDSDMEEVRVVARAPEKAEMPELLPEMQTEWVDDYDNDHYGLLVKFTDGQKVPFRLFFTAGGQGGAIDNSVKP